jgi:hypothetical protein
MGNQVPGPMCTSRVGDNWIDQGTMCLTQSLPPGPCAALAGCTTTKLPGRNKSRFDSEHIYSQAKEAVTKRAIDLQIIGGDYSRSGEISLDSEDYLKKLIDLGSGHTRKVSAKGTGLQFFIIHGGGEGFLPPEEGAEKLDAGHTAGPGETTDKTVTKNIYDVNDIIAVFDRTGGLVTSGYLIRPLFVPNHLSEEKANEVYNSWDGKNVSIYRNTYWYDTKGGVIYLGLAVADGYRGSGPGTVTIDMHKTEQTNGCIWIHDPDTPSLNLRDKDGKRVLDSFEPKLIVDILKAKGMTPEDVKAQHTYYLGTMQTIDIT